MQWESTREMEEERMASDSEEEDEKCLHCCCQMPSTDLPYVACDSCNIWFHFTCVGLESKTAKTVRKFICPVCKASKGETKDLKNTMARIRKTRCFLLPQAIPLSLRKVSLAFKRIPGRLLEHLTCQVTAFMCASTG